MTTQQKVLKWNVYSPDGFTIHHDKQWDSKEEAIIALEEWIQRYRAQGYYSSAAHGRIPLKDISIYCKFIQEESYIDDDVRQQCFDEFLGKTDWPLLAQQKLGLVAMMMKEGIDPKEEEVLEGIISYLDHIQDYAVDVIGLDERLVFPHLKNEVE